MTIRELIEVLERAEKQANWRDAPVYLHDPAGGDLPYVFEFSEFEVGFDQELRVIVLFFR